MVPENRKLAKYGKAMAGQARPGCRGSANMPTTKPAQLASSRKAAAELTRGKDKEVLNT